MNAIWRTFREFFLWSTIVTVTGLGVIGVIDGWTALGIVAILSVLEVTLSFDNAVANATILRRLNAKWQKLFLTLGILIAVGVMRIVFPIAIVALTAHPHLSMVKVADLAINHPQQYGVRLDDAHSVIAMFAGIYLLQIALDFFFEERETTWLAWLEKPLAKLGKLDNLSTIISALVVLVLGQLDHSSHQLSLFIAGLSAIILYQVVAVISGHFEDKSEEADEDQEAHPGAVILATGKHAFALFLMLEVQDASFSFDGVSGAFAITDNVKYIALGLTIGAFFVRSLTIYLVKKGKLDDLRYLEHGAYWAILSLGCLMLASVFFEIKEYVTGSLSLALIVSAFVGSMIANKRDARNKSDNPSTDANTLKGESVQA